MPEEKLAPIDARLIKRGRFIEIKSAFNDGAH